MRDEPIYDYVERGKVEALVADVKALRARVADRDHELIRVRAELAEARAERDRLRAAIEENTFHDRDIHERDEYTHECLPNCWRCELDATPAAAERPEQGETGEGE